MKRQKKQNLREQYLTTARIKYIRISPFKLRRVCDVIRGKNVTESLYILASLPHKGARIMKKVLNSVVANAKENNKISDVSNLFIDTVMVDTAPVMKRFQPRARGRMFSIAKRNSHVFVGLQQREGA